MPNTHSQLDAAAGAGTEEGRRPTIVPAPAAASPELSVQPKRRIFSAATKLRILAETDRAADTSGIAAIRDGYDDTQPCRQHYRCNACTGRFDDLTGTVLAGHHQPLRVWVLCLYFMGLNLSNQRGSARLLWREKRSGV